jgi:hypothetical protein
VESLPKRVEAVIETKEGQDQAWPAEEWRTPSYPEWCSYLIYEHRQGSNSKNTGFLLIL